MVPNAQPPQGLDSSARFRSGRRALALLAACHPEPAAAVTALTGLLSLSAGRGWGTLWVVAAVGAGQLGVGWSNDYLDRERDRAGRRRDKPVAAGHIGPRPVGIASLLALAACVPLSFASGPGFALAHLAAIACALAYNAGLKALPVSVVPYAIAFALLPTAVTLGLPEPRWPQPWAVLACMLMGSGAHFTQALADIPGDRRLGSRGLPQLLGQRTSGLIAVLLLAAASLTVAFAHGRPGSLQLAGTAVTLALAAATLIAAGIGRSRLAFRLTLLVAASTVVSFLLGGREL